MTGSVIKAAVVVLSGTLECSYYLVVLSTTLDSRRSSSAVFCSANAKQGFDSPAVEVEPHTALGASIGGIGSKPI